MNSGRILQANPPGGEGGEPGEGVGGKGNAIIGAYPVGQAIFFEQAVEDGFCAENSRGMKALAADDVAADVIGDGEREAIDTVAGFELALEISAPEVVGGENGVRGFTGMTNPTLTAGSGNQAVALEEIADGGSAGKIPIGVAAMNNFQDLFGTPIGVLSSHIEKRFNDFGIGLIGEVIWFPW